MKQTSDHRTGENSFRDILKRERALRRWSQADVAERIGSDPKTVGRWERGLTFPSPYMCQRLSELYGKTMQELHLVRDYQNHPESGETLAEVAPTIQDFRFQQSEQAEVAQAQRRLSWRGTWRPWAVSGLLGVITLLIVMSVWGPFHQNSPVPRAAALSTSPYTGKGALVLSNSLKENTAARWPTIPNEEGACSFVNSGYQIKAIRPGGYMKLCLADETNFSNLTSEVTMQIVKGDGCGGLALRGTYAQLYYFLVCRDGRYRFVRYDRDDFKNTLIITSGVSSLIQAGLNSTNVLAVVAYGNAFTLYVNHIRLYQGTDNAYLDGHIGLMAHPCSTTYSDPQLNLCPVPLEVLFRSIKVWTS